jgi:ubiquinone/menaquinone biosynthesis C-methylase UbiE
MTHTENDHPSQRFTGLATDYARGRPDYPRAAVDHILRHCRLGPGALVIDVGCGTGISSRLFAERGLLVVGIEPNADMRSQAESQSMPDVAHPPTYREGSAEATGMHDDCADLILAAQAFHWFEPTATLREFHRILKPTGWAALMWNERDHRDPFTAAYGAIIARDAHAQSLEAHRSRSGEVLLQSPLYCRTSLERFSHQQKLDEDGLLRRAFSTTYAPREPEQSAAFTDALKRVFAGFQHHGQVHLVYETSVYLGQRSST